MGDELLSLLELSIELPGEVGNLFILNLNVLPKANHLRLPPLFLCRLEQLAHVLVGQLPPLVFGAKGVLVFESLLVRGELLARGEGLVNHLELLLAFVLSECFPRLQLYLSELLLDLLLRERVFLDQGLDLLRVGLSLSVVDVFLLALDVDVGDKSLLNQVLFEVVDSDHVGQPPRHPA